MQEKEQPFSFIETTPSPSSIAQGCNGTSKQPAEVGRLESVLLPAPTEHEPASSTEWFETTYVSQVHLESFPQLALKARGDRARCCSFGERRMGGLNVAITLVFDDGVEWIIKTPKFIDEASLERLECEAATLLFLEKVGSLPTPRLHAYSITAENSARTPYIIMDKTLGVTLGEAIYTGLGREGVYRTLENLATFRKILQQHPFPETGSLFLGETEDYFRAENSVVDPLEMEPYFIAQLNNLWGAELDPKRYRRHFGVDSTGYYIGQHDLSLLSEPIYGTAEEKKLKSLVHFYMGLVLPNYAIDSIIFYLAHTDLSISNLLVDPSTGDLLGVIDWEFANSLPPQAVEHYPVFLVDRTRFVERYEGFYPDPNAEFDAWRAHYNKQFGDLPETFEFNKRIDAIFNFEQLLRYPNERSLTKIANALEALQSTNALSEPLPDLPWLSHLLQKSPPIPTNIKPTPVIPSYGLPTPPSTLPLPLNPPVTPTRNTSAPPRSSPLRNEIRTCDSYTTEEEPDPATEGIERVTTPFKAKENRTTSHLSIFQKSRIHSVSTDASSAQTTISTVFDSEGSRPESVSSVGTDYLTTFQEVASKSESPRIDTPNTVVQPNLAIALEVSSADISHDSFPHDMVDDTNSNLRSTDATIPQIHVETEIEKSLGPVSSADISHDSFPHDTVHHTNINLHSTDAKTPQSHAETEIEKLLGKANPLIEVAEPAAEPSHNVLSSIIIGDSTNNEDLNVTKGRSVDCEIQTEISITKHATMGDMLGLMDVKEEVSKEGCPQCSKEKASQQVSTTPTPTPDLEPGTGEGGSVSESRKPRFYGAALGGCFNVYRRCRKVFARKERPSG